MGLEDLDGMERIFSGSNQLASVVRYASAYCRRQFINLYLQQWDADKYENLVTWLYNNYVQATKIIDEETLALEHAMQSLGIAGTEELNRWQAEELQYLQTLGKEDYDVMAVAYVERLQELNEIR
jgi:Kyakuja-Dileera-Zisupton transposase